MASLRFQFSHVGLPSASVQQHRRRSPNSLGFAHCSPSAIPPVRCGLRGAGTRKPLWRSAVMSTEAIQAVQALKLAKKGSSSSPPDSLSSSPGGGGGKLEGVLRGRVARLIKADLVAVLAELQRQNEWELALRVFEFIRKEEWYQPNVSLYSDMIYMAGKNKLTEIAEELFSGIEEEGLQPNTRAYTEMVGVFLKVGSLDKAMEIYNSMKESGCPPDELTFTILIRNLEKAGEHDLASAVKKDCEDFLEYPEKFLEEVGKKYPKRRSLKLV